MVISIHQPNFMPWYPFFEKIMKSDIFVVLGHCDFEKNNYQNRFHYRGMWNTLSVKTSGKKIVQKEYSQPEYDWKKIKKRIFDQDLSIFDDCISESLFETNVSVIKRWCSILNLSTEIVFDYETTLSKTDRLLDLCKEYNATTYLSGPSGKHYLEIDKFDRNDITVDFFSYSKKRHTIDCI